LFSYLGCAHIVYRKFFSQPTELIVDYVYYWYCLMELLYNGYILDILLCLDNHADVMVKVQHLWGVHLQREEVQQSERDCGG